MSPGYGRVTELSEMRLGFSMCESMLISYSTVLTLTLPLVNHNCVWSLGILWVPCKTTSKFMDS